MNNILICTEKKEDIDELINTGISFVKDEFDKAYLVNIGSYEMYYMNQTEEGEELDYIYRKALEFDMRVKVLRSNDVAKSLIDFIQENHITHVVMEKNKIIRELNELKAKLTYIEFIVI